MPDPNDPNFVPPDARGEKPSPEETAEAYKNLKTRSDLEAMLKEVERIRGPGVVGPDGKPTQTPEEQRAAIQAEMERQRRDKIMELGARMRRLSSTDKEFASCLVLLREANCLINLALSEMSTLEGVDDELIGFSDEFLRQSVRNDPNDQLEDLIKRIEEQVLVYLHNKKYELDKLQARRREAFLALAEIHPRKEPVVLTDPIHDLGMHAAGIPHMPLGMVYVFFSEGSEPEDMALEVYQRFKKAGYHSILMADGIKGSGCLPRRWWEGACDLPDSIGGVLDPVLKKRQKSQILIVSSLDGMLGSQKRKDDSPKYRQQALLRIARWCLNNQVLGLVFSEGSAESRSWLGRSITLKKGNANVDGDRVQGGGGQAVDGPASDRGGQAPQGPGEDQGRPGGEDGAAG